MECGDNPPVPLESTRMPHRVSRRQRARSLGTAFRFYMPMGSPIDNGTRDLAGDHPEPSKATGMVVECLPLRWTGAGFGDKYSPCLPALTRGIR